MSVYLEVAKSKVIESKKNIDSLTKRIDVLSPRSIEFLHNASWHLNQALKIIDEVEK